MHLDFLQPHARRFGVGVFLLLVGVAAAGTTLVHRHQTAQEAKRLDDRLTDARRMARREMPLLDSRIARGRVLAEEIRSANAVIERMNVPWDALFGELEAAGDEGVTLLAIQPDPASRQLRISGEARRLDAVLAYVARLEARDGLQNVYLVGHELREAPPRPVAFSLSAEWKKVR